jgi:5'-nucleotidase
MRLLVILAAALLVFASPASARNILLSNDDGLTSNLTALYQALKPQDTM